MRRVGLMSLKSLTGAPPRVFLAFDSSVEASVWAGAEVKPGASGDFGLYPCLGGALLSRGAALSVLAASGGRTGLGGGSKSLTCLPVGPNFTKAALGGGGVRKALVL